MRTRIIQPHPHRSPEESFLLRTHNVLRIEAPQMQDLGGGHQEIQRIQKHVATPRPPGFLDPAKDPLQPRSRHPLWRRVQRAIGYKAIIVNGRSVNIASYQVTPDDVVLVTEAAKAQLRIQAALQLASQRAQVQWVDVDPNKMEGTYKRFPDREELPQEINENLIVELYSK